MRHGGKSFRPTSFSTISTLIEVARRRPASLAALAQIPGIGHSKLERYGSAVIEIVATAEQTAPPDPVETAAASPHPGARAAD